MCRWLGYRGSPIRPAELLYDPERSLIEQSRVHAPGMSVPNADGHGFGWYGHRSVPAIFRSADPAWAEENLREVSSEVASGLFLAHVRAATGTPVQRTNCHPFRYERWLFVHNGYIADFERVRRDLLFAVDPAFFRTIAGSTDSELMFHLALTFGLADDPLGALERMAGFIEACAGEQGIEEPLQMTVGLTDGDNLYAARYASGPVVNSLFVSEDVTSVRLLYPEKERFAHFSDDARVVVSEPLVDLAGLWREVPPGTALRLASTLEEHAFRPRPPH